MSNDPYTPTWIDILAGTLTMGSDARDAARPFANEQPQHPITLPAFHISRVPVTNAQYQDFVIHTGHPPPGHWPAGQPAQGSEQFPVTYVSWLDAQAFCAWAGVRLPSEAEWEKAARSDDGRWWPWGNELPDHTRCHFDGQAQGMAPASQSVLPVGQFPRGASPYGALDMAGNVWEWTHSHYQPYPYDANDGREDPVSPGLRVVRSGSYNHNLRQIRCAARDGIAAGARDVYIGFRVVSSHLAPNTLNTLNTLNTFNTFNTLDTFNTPNPAFDWVTVPEGSFLLGSTAAPLSSAVLPSEMPQHHVQVARFRLAQTPVTNADYARFVRATRHPMPSHWFSGDVPAGLEQHPVTHVDWHDAQAFCEWANVRLPTEAEWEMAARGPAPMHDRPHIYPWGNERPDNTRLNYRRGTRLARTTPVNQYPRGASPYGVLDMAGNVWEWMSSLYAPYPYLADDGREDLQRMGPRVLRGGSFASPGTRFVRCVMRSLSYPTRRREHIGFRVAQ